MSLFNTQRKKVGKVHDKGAVQASPVKTAPVKAEKVAKTAKKETAKKTVVVAVKNSVIIKPRVTEKAGLLAEKGIYTFDVAISANSQQISAEIRKTYKVTPVKVSVAAVPGKSMFVRGKSGMTNAGKKAYVYLKKGDKIEFI